MKAKREEEGARCRSGVDWKRGFERARNSWSPKAGPGCEKPSLVKGRH